MVPLKDYNPGRTTPYVTYGLIILNIVIFIYELRPFPLRSLTEFFGRLGGGAGGSFPFSFRYRAFLR